MALFRVCIPTDIDVRKLRDAFPDTTLTAGFVVTYDAICKLLDIPSSEASRFISVTKAWRKRLARESGIYFKAQDGKFTVLDDAGKADLSIQKTTSAVRRVRDSVIVAKSVNRNMMTEDQLKRFDTAQRYNSSVLAIQTIKQKIELPTL